MGMQLRALQMVLMLIHSHTQLSSPITESLNTSYPSITFVSGGTPWKIEARTVRPHDNSFTHSPVIRSILVNRHTTRGQPLDPRDPRLTSAIVARC